MILEEIELTLDDYPLILVQGHAISIGEAANFLNEYKKTGSFNKFENFQKKLDEDNLYENKNIILPFQEINNTCDKNWNKKISVRTTYYIDEYGNFDDKKSIEIYAERLSKVVNILKKLRRNNLNAFFFRNYEHFTIFFKVVFFN